jgi:hypothetical protein
MDVNAECTGKWVNVNGDVHNLRKSPRMPHANSLNSDRQSLRIYYRFIIIFRHMCV